MGLHPLHLHRHAAPEGLEVPPSTALCCRRLSPSGQGELHRSEGKATRQVLVTQRGSQGAIAPLPATACPQRSAASFWAVLWCLRGTWPACSLPTLTYTRSKEAEPGPRLARTDRRARAEPASEAGAHPAATSFAPSCWGCRRRAACPDCLTRGETSPHRQSCSAKSQFSRNVGCYRSTPRQVASKPSPL